METTLLIKDTLNVQVLYDTLSTGKIYFINDTTKACKNYVECTGYFNSTTLIIGIICFTIILLAIIGYSVYTIGQLKCKPIVEKTKADENDIDKQIRESQYQELKHYRSQLANFLEKKAITKEAKCMDDEGGEYVNRSFNNEDSQIYITKLEEYIRFLSSQLEKQQEELKLEKQQEDLNSQTENHV